MQNRPLLITIGIFILLIILGVWLYLFLFGAPEDGGEVFSNLGVFPDGGPAAPVIETNNQQPRVDVSGEPLRQLTTKPVAGFSATNNEVQFVEAGTGYIFSIDLTTGEQTQRTNTTIAGTVTADFSPNRTHVALTRFDAYTPVVTIGTITGDTLETVELEPGATNIFGEGETRLRYTLTRNGATIGFEQDLQEEVREELFVFDLAQAWVDWSEATPIVWSAPALNFPSTAYEITGTALTPLPVRRSALQVHRLPGEQLIYTMRQGDILESSSASTTMAQSLLREKCVDRVVGDWLYCGGPITRVTAEEYFDWLKGVHQSDDQLWRTDLRTGGATLIIDPERQSGRSLDITKPQLNPQNDFFFINKTDQTLWMVDVDAV